MRTIKFRAWDNQLNKWANDNDIHLDLNFSCVHDYFIKNGHEETRFELMQYTGLKDKNEVEIFEADVVENDGGKWVVSFNRGCFCGNLLPNLRSDDELLIALRAIKGIEVIGNIYENPELLK